MNSIKELIYYLSNKDNIFLYGAGHVAERIYFLLKEERIFISGFIVSSQNDKRRLYGLPIYTLNQIRREEKVPSMNVILAIQGKNYELFKDLVNSGFKSIAFLDNKCISELYRLELQRIYGCQQEEYVIDFFYPHIEKDMAILKEKETGKNLFRIFLYGKAEDTNTLIEQCTKAIFESEYGDLYIVEKKDQDKKDNVRIQLYVATSHLDKMQINEIQDIFRVPIQVGAAFTKLRKGCITDLEGDSISARNRDYCECTALYWIWKNTYGQDYVGLEHYRRRLKIDPYRMSLIGEKSADVVLSLPQFCMKKVKDFFVDILITSYDWELMYQFVEEYDSSFKVALKKYENAWFYFSCNLCLFKRNWFDQYCKFAFSVAFKIDDFYKQRGVIRQDRYMGYIFENLLSIFIMRYYKEMEVICTEVEWIE